MQGEPLGIAAVEFHTGQQDTFRVAWPTY